MDGPNNRFRRDLISQTAQKIRFAGINFRGLLKKTHEIHEILYH